MSQMLARKCTFQLESVEACALLRTVELSEIRLSVLDNDEETKKSKR